MNTVTKAAAEYIELRLIEPPGPQWKGGQEALLLEAAGHADGTMLLGWDLFVEDMINGATCSHITFLPGMVKALFRPGDITAAHVHERLETMYDALWEAEGVDLGGILRVEEGPPGPGEWGEDTLDGDGGEPMIILE